MRTSSGGTESGSKAARDASRVLSILARVDCKAAMLSRIGIGSISTQVEQ